MTEQKRGWLDPTISLQRLAMWLIGGGVAVALYVGAWAYGIDKQVAKNTADNNEQERHFDRIETAMQQQRNDTNQQLRDISSDVKDIRNFIMNNSAAARPGVDRWSKP